MIRMDVSVLLFVERLGGYNGDDWNPLDLPCPQEEVGPSPFPYQS